MIYVYFNHKGCQSGVYGKYCAISCPSNCKDNVCHIQEGTCFVCKPGWREISCSIKCTEGWYGINCSQQCVGHCRDGTTCNHVTGRCDEGCAEGWTGAMCHEECVYSYGENCRYLCSALCINQTCDRFNGRCLFGCIDGKTCDLGKWIP